MVYRTCNGCGGEIAPGHMCRIQPPRPPADTGYLQESTQKLQMMSGRTVFLFASIYECDAFDAGVDCAFNGRTPSAEDYIAAQVKLRDDPDACARMKTAYIEGYNEQWRAMDRYIKQLRSMNTIKPKREVVPFGVVPPKPQGPALRSVGGPPESVDPWYDDLPGPTSAFVRLALPRIALAGFIWLFIWFAHVLRHIMFTLVQP